MSPRNPLHDVAIVGVYNTKQARVLEGVTTTDLVVESIRGVLADAGMEGSEVSGVCDDVFGCPDHGDVVRVFVSRPLAGDVIRMLGGHPSMRSSAAGIPAVLQTAAAIATGMFETGIIYSAQARLYQDRDRTAPWTRPSTEFIEWTGLHTPAEFALIAKRHMHEYGTKPEALAEVASAIRSNGATNPAAVYYGRECSPEDVLNSRMVADPYHLLDCCTTTEGGAAILLTTAERAQSLGVKPVYILGGTSEEQGVAYVESPLFEKFGRLGRSGGQRTFQMAGLEPKDIDVCEFYDNFSWEIIRLFEAYGFCGEGEGGDFVTGGRIRIDGELPICTDGGLMSFSHAGSAGPLQRIISGVQQLRGTHANQVAKEVNHVLCQNFGSAGLANGTMIISAEQL
jgi:acetyl-CoA acetyltransferase